MKTVKHIAASLFVINAGCASLPATAANENAVICQGCNYQQAQQLAIEHARPVLHCVTNDGGDVINIGNQSCTSQPKKIVIFDAGSRQAFPFEVYHTNQGSNPVDMQVQVTNRSVDSNIVDLLKITSDMHKELNDSIPGLAASLADNFSSLSTAISTPAVTAQFAATQSAQTECQDDADAQALLDYFDGAKQTALALYVNSLHREKYDSIANTFKNLFNLYSVQLNTVTFSISKGGNSLSGTFSITPKTTSLTATYSGGSDIIVEEGKGIFAPGYPQLVYDIKPNANGTVDVLMDDTLSNVGGYMMSQIKGNSQGQALTLSSCVVQALQYAQPLMQIVTPSGATYDPSNGGGSGGAGGVGGMCTLYGKVNGTIVLVMRVMC